MAAHARHHPKPVKRRVVKTPAKKPGFVTKKVRKRKRA